MQRLYTHQGPWPWWAPGLQYLQGLGNRGVGEGLVVLLCWTGHPGYWNWNFWVPLHWCSAYWDKIKCATQAHCLHLALSKVSKTLAKDVCGSNVGNFFWASPGLKTKQSQHLFAPAGQPRGLLVFWWNLLCHHKKGITLSEAHRGQLPTATLPRSNLWEPYLCDFPRGPACLWKSLPNPSGPWGVATATKQALLQGGLASSSASASWGFQQTAQQELPC